MSKQNESTKTADGRVGSGALFGAWSQAIEPPRNLYITQDDLRRITRSVVKVMALLSDGEWHIFRARLNFSEMVWAMSRAELVEYDYSGLEEGQDVRTEQIAVRLHESIRRRVSPNASGEPCPPPANQSPKYHE